MDRAARLGFLLAAFLDPSIDKIDRIDGRRFGMVESINRDRGIECRGFALTTRAEFMIGPQRRLSASIRHFPPLNSLEAIIAWPPATEQSPAPNGHPDNAMAN